MNGKILNTVGATIQDVASSVINGQTAKAIFPGTEALQKEINDRVASYANNGTYFKLFKDGLGNSGSEVNKEIQEIFAQRFDSDLLNSIGIDAKRAEEIATLRDSVTRENVDETISSIQKIAGDDKFSEYVDTIVKPQVANDVHGLNAETVIPGIGMGNYILNVPRAYYSNPDPKIRNTRIAATVGAYAGVAIGGRYLSGGTLTTDSYGRKDIAGIPFI